MQKNFFILGADDPEMREIVKILTEKGEMFVFAKIEKERVNPGQAYEADAVEVPDGYTPVLIETEPANFKDRTDVARIDHHREGDLGYNLDYTRYLEASSLIRLLKLFGMEPTPEQKVLAAMDHCFLDALEGRCEGVTKNEVLRLKIQNIAESTRSEYIVVQEKILYWLKKIKKSTDSVIVDGIKIVNLTMRNMGIGYSENLLSAQVAAALSGGAVLFKRKDSKGSPYKISINGRNSEATIRYFRDVFCKANHLEAFYGVLTRGYAGAIFSDETNNILQLPLLNDAKEKIKRH